MAAVSAIVDEGNIVVFGPAEGGSFIQNVATGEKIGMKRKKGTYVIEAEIKTENVDKMDVDMVDGKQNVEMDEAAVDDVKGKIEMEDQSVFMRRA